MKRLLLIASLAVSVTTAAPALADGIEDVLLNQLRDQGFAEIRLSRTLLGRRRIVAVGPEYKREIIVNPRTGEILRDYWTLIRSDDDSDGGWLFNPSGGGGEGDDRAGDDHDDDHDDDDHDDDGHDDDGHDGDDSDGGGGDDDD